MNEVRVGEKIRRRRNDLGLTLRELATQTELTSGFLSQVENDRVSPSLKSLCRIADVLRTPLFHLLSTESGDPVVKRENRTSVPFGNTGHSVELLTPFRNWQLLPFQRVFDPFEVSVAIHLERAREEWMMVLSGGVEVRLKPDTVHPVDEGDTIHFESSQLVSVTNPHPVPAVCVYMMTPPAI